MILLLDCHGFWILFALLSGMSEVIRLCHEDRKDPKETLKSMEVKEKRKTTVSVENVMQLEVIIYTLVRRKLSLLP